MILVFAMVGFGLRFSTELYEEVIDICVRRVKTRFFITTARSDAALVYAILYCYINTDSLPP